MLLAALSVEKMGLNWFVCAILSTLLWACADLFYKKGADSEDKYSHLRTVIMVGFVMGIHAIAYMIINKLEFNPMHLLLYLPVSFCYIFSMTVGYIGLRYLELSIVSPIQNSSGAVAAILLFFLGGAKIGELVTPTGMINVVGILIITAGVLGLAFIEKKEEIPVEVTSENKKYISGLVAICFPIVYCIFDSLGTVLDGVYLDQREIMTSDEALIAYELTFLIAAVVCLLFLTVVKKEKFSIIGERDKGFAAIFETAGQFFYVFAMEGEAIVAAPIVASYCIFSVILSRIFLKEKLSRMKYVTVALVMAGIVILGISEGISEEYGDEISEEDVVTVSAVE